MVIELGDKVKDKITGFTGIETIRSEFINGCVQFTVEAKLKNNILPSTVNDNRLSIDQQSLEVIEKDALHLKNKEEVKIIKRKTGGPTLKGFKFRGY